ncbi:MAG: hypothetical protein RLZZ225_120 [Pseudomonadota bacterium]|jgi:ankyrin repeat protein
MPTEGRKTMAQAARSDDVKGIKTAITALRKFIVPPAQMPHYPLDEAIAKNQRRALHLAAHHGSLKVIKYLSEQGADIDILDSNGNTPAHIAAISHQRNALQSLFNHGANRSIKNEAGLIPEAAGFIIEALRDISRGDSKSLKYRLQPAHYLFRRRNDVDNDGNTLLHHAVKNRSSSCIDVLLERRANPFIKNKMGKTPAELAANMEYFELLEKLSSLHVLKGLDDQDTEGNTPLHRAVKSGRIDCTDVLLKRKANPFIKNKMGKTPGELAANSGYFALANKLHSSSFLSAGRLSAQLKEGSFNQHSLKLGGSMTPKKGYCP